MPVIRLNTVVFPAPFGPIMLIISFGKTSISRSCTAARPPKCLETLANFNIGSLVCSTACSTPIANSCSLLLNAHFRFEARRSRHHIQRTHLDSFIFRMTQLAPSTCTGNEPFGSIDHNHDQNDTKDQVTYIAKGEPLNAMSDNKVLNRK